MNNLPADLASLLPEVIEPPGPLPDHSGPRSATGECLGQLQIFPGKGSRCRLSGVMTTFQNCCKPPANFMALIKAAQLL